MTFRQNFFVFKIGVETNFESRVRVRVGVWNRVTVSKTVAFLRCATLRPAKQPLPLCLVLKKLPEHHGKSVPMTTVEGRGVLTFLFPRGTVVLKCGPKHSKYKVIPLVVSYISRTFVHSCNY